MYPIDWETVEAFAQAEGRSISDAIRRIIREWLRIQQARARLAADDCCEEGARAAMEIPHALG